MCDSWWMRWLWNISKCPSISTIVLALETLCLAVMTTSIMNLMISWSFGNRIEKFNGQLKIYRENCKEYFYFFGLYRTLFSLLKKKRKKRWIWLFERRREMENRPWMCLFLRNLLRNKIFLSWLKPFHFWTTMSIAKQSFIEEKFIFQGVRAQEKVPLSN